MKRKLIFLCLSFFAGCLNAGFDTGDVMRANEAYTKVIDAFVYKSYECRSQGNTYNFLFSTNGIPSVSYCNSDIIRENKGNFVWKKSVNTCLNLITFAPCPENGSNFDNWSILVYGGCNLSEAYFLNDYKPLQGKIIGAPRTIDGLQFNCL